MLFSEYDDMLNKVLLTPIDSLVEYLKEKRECTIKELHKKIDVPLETVEKWLAVLEEYGVVKVSYRGFDAYVLYVEDSIISSWAKGHELDVEQVRDLFVEKSKQKNFSYDKIQKLWPFFLSEHEAELKDLFARKAKRLGYDMTKLDKAWEKYKDEVKSI